MMLRATLLALAIALLAGCSGLHHLDGQSFDAIMRNPVASIHSYTFIGVSGKRAYFEDWRLYPIFGARTNVCWTNLAELPEDAQKKLRAGVNPWQSAFIPFAGVFPPPGPKESDIPLDMPAGLTVRGEIVNFGRDGRHLGRSSPWRSVISGRLRSPFGTWITIEGSTAPEMKAGMPVLLVGKVNGIALPSPVAIPVENPGGGGLAPGARSILRGYESFKLIGVPPNVARAEMLPAPQPPWRFVTYFVVTSVGRPSSVTGE